MANGGRRSEYPGKNPGCRNHFSAGTGCACFAVCDKIYAVHVSFGNTAALNAPVDGRLMDAPIELDDQKVWQFYPHQVSAPEKLGKSGTEKESRMNLVSIFSWPGLQIN